MIGGPEGWGGGPFVQINSGIGRAEGPPGRSPPGRSPPGRGPERLAVRPARGPADEAAAAAAVEFRPSVAARPPAGRITAVGAVGESAHSAFVQVLP